MMFRKGRVSENSDFTTGHCIKSGQGREGFKTVQYTMRIDTIDKSHKRRRKKPLLGPLALLAVKKSVLSNEMRLEFC